MDNSTEVIRQQMEETRSSLQEKLETLEEQVKGTVQEATETVATVKETVEAVKDTVKESVETVKDSVQDTVQTVKNSLDLDRQMREHPWALFAGATAVGFVGGRLLGRAMEAMEPPSYASRPRAQFTGAPYAPRFTPAAAPQGNGHEAASPAKAQPSWLSGITDRFGDELAKVKSLAISAVGGMVREMVTSSTPPPLAERLKEVVDSLTTKLGGRPLEGSSANRESHGTPERGEQRDERYEAKMGRPLGAA